MISPIARAERDLFIAAGEVVSFGRTTALRIAAATYGALLLDQSLPLGSEYPTTLPECESCGLPAVHAEVHFDERRFWCTEHARSGHYLEHCGATCEALCCEDEP